eukprot:3123278-Rhodomonas_salina.2
MLTSLDLPNNSATPTHLRNNAQSTAVNSGLACAFWSCSINSECCFAKNFSAPLNNFSWLSDSPFSPSSEMRLSNSTALTNVVITTMPATCTWRNQIQAAGSGLWSRV